MPGVLSAYLTVDVLKAELFSRAAEDLEAIIATLPKEKVRTDIL